jgi:hypothetical protein
LFLKGDFENAASGYEKLLDEKIKSEVKRKTSNECHHHVCPVIESPTII